MTDLEIRNMEPPRKEWCCARCGRQFIEERFYANWVPVGDDLRVLEKMMAAYALEPVISVKDGWNRAATNVTWVPMCFFCQEAFSSSLETSLASRTISIGWIEKPFTLLAGMIAAAIDINLRMERVILVDKEYYNAFVERAVDGIANAMKAADIRGIIDC